MFKQELFLGVLRMGRKGFGDVGRGLYQFRKGLEGRSFLSLAAFPNLNLRVVWNPLSKNQSRRQ
jgi:hypothetical protein